MNKYFGDIEDVKFGQFTASARPLFRASRPGHEKTGISIKFKYHPNQKASSLICGHVLKWILTGIFYGFLKIYKILRILRERDIVKFQRPKITSDTWFQTERDIPHQKQSLSFQNMFSKLWATSEMNFWERKIHGALECNLTFLTWQLRGSARHKSILQQMFQPKYV